MSEKIDILTNALWFAQPVLQSAIATAMFRCGQHRVFKYLFAYILAQIPINALLIPIYFYSPPSSYRYFYADWFATVFSIGLGFKVIHEAFLDVFQGFGSPRMLSRLLFRWPGLMLLLVAVALAFSTNPAKVTPWVQPMLVARTGARIIQVGMVLFILFFACYLGVSRRRQSFGTALGFCVFAVVELALMNTVAGRLSGDAGDLINVVAYNLSLLIWLGYSLANAPARQGAVTVLPPRRRDQRFAGIHRPVPAHLPIPMFETVGTDALSSVAMSQPTDAADRELKTACDMFIAAYKNIEAKYPDLATENAQPHEAITDYIRTQIHN
jgi:hypothetical protein